MISIQAFNMSVKQRDSLKNSIVRLNKFINNNMPLADAQVTLESLEDYYRRYVNVQLEVVDTAGMETRDFEETEMVNTERVFLKSKILLRQIIDTHQRNLAEEQLRLHPAAPVHVNQVADIDRAPRINSKMNYLNLAANIVNGPHFLTYSLH